MIPTLYTKEMCSGCNEIKQMLHEEHIKNYQEIRLTNDINILREAITKIRSMQRPGQFRELAILPIIEFENSAYNYDDIIKYWDLIQEEFRIATQHEENHKKIQLKIKKHQEYEPRALSLTSLASINTSMLRLTKSNNTEEQLMVIFENWSQKERAAFMTGTRLAKHNSAQQLNRFIEMITAMAETMDEHQNGYDEPLE